MLEYVPHFIYLDSKLNLFDYPHLFKVSRVSMEGEIHSHLANSSENIIISSTETPTPKSNPPGTNSSVSISRTPFCLEKTDQTISRLSNILSTPAGTDTILLTLSYTMLLTSSILTSISLARIRSTTRLLIDKLLTLPPDTTVILTTTMIPSSRLLNLSMRFKALSTLISDVRIFARLWGLLGIWTWGKKILTEDSNDDGFLRRVNILQVSVNIAYQFLENCAYLSEKGVLGWSQEKQRRAWIWSSRFWALHVFLEYLRLWRQKRIQDKSGGTKAGDVELKTVDWKKQVLINTAYAPLTLHWSSEKGLISEFWVGLLGSMIGLVKIQEAWRQVA